MKRVTRDTEIVDCTCRTRLKGIRCDTPPVKYRNWDSYVKRQQSRPGDLLKNIPAAEKMVPPVARGNQVDGKGRGVLLTTEAAIRTKERGWIHASRIKGPVDEPKEWTITSEPGDTKLTLKRGLGGNELGTPKWSKKHTQDHT
ncbi:hypothetical protein DUI87_03270 [Hirundo rustica rustica]|uniref:Uncharacterized protein n=1 Tax=Hirundo rustica rustica TaxID=333673 RepID=A0A3M0L3N0_HIRRU|nr:hypothetical protein DUI87_03270 [Hirundo rustica rustica]